MFKIDRKATLARLARLEKKARIVGLTEIARRAKITGVSKNGIVLEMAEMARKLQNGVN